MKLLLKIFRNGLGAIIAFVSWIIPTNKVIRSEAQQQAVDQQTKELELYQFFACPFCIKSRRLIRKLNLKIVVRNAQTAGLYRDELLKEGNKVQVPCLKISQDSKTTWLYESSAIEAYLKERFG